MGDLAVDTAICGSGGTYRACLSRAWDIWGPNGGYLAVIALRAAGAAAAEAEPRLVRPASFSCQYLNVADFQDVDICVDPLRLSKRAAAFRVLMMQQQKPILSALAWIVDHALDGLAHDVARMPDVPTYAQLQPFHELAPNYDEWYPFWGNVEGRPVHWVPWDEWGPGEPVWQTWVRLVPKATFDDPFLDAGRALLWLDTLMWPAASNAHGPGPFIAPNLDVNVQFHRSALEHEWLLCDGYSPIAMEGLVGCVGRVWSPDGALLASAGGQLFCRPNPMWKPETEFGAQG